MMLDRQYCGHKHFCVCFTSRCVLKKKMKMCVEDVFFRPYNYVEYEDIRSTLPTLNLTLNRWSGGTDKENEATNFSRKWGKEFVINCFYRM